MFRVFLDGVYSGIRVGYFLCPSLWHLNLLTRMKTVFFKLSMHKALFIFIGLYSRFEYLWCCFWSTDENSVLNWFFWSITFNSDVKGK